MSSTARNGFHGPNCPLNRAPSEPNGPPTPRSLGFRIGAGQFQHAKLLQADHQRADAEWLRERGLQVLVRCRGEGIVHWEDVQKVIDQYKGLATVVEVGNEPAPTAEYPTWEKLLWNHAAYLDGVLEHCLTPAHDAGMRLCVGGWRTDFDPPRVGLVLPGPPAPYQLDAPIVARLRAVYGRFDAIAQHVYDPWQLTSGYPQAHMAAWRAAFPGHPVYVTEYGIAARAVPDEEKARRYAAFVRSLPDYVQAAYVFIISGTADWYAFNQGGYDPAGENGYVLSDAAWAELGRAL